MLKTRVDIANKGLKLPFILEQEVSDGGVSDYYDEILKNALVNVMNPEVDYEYRTYKLDVDELVVDMFFFTYLNETSDPFTDPVSYVSNEVLGDAYKTYETTLINNLNPNKYVEYDRTVRDNVQQFNRKKPMNTGIPSFYPSFTYAYGNAYSNWLSDPNLFMDKQFLYESFLRVDFQTTPSAFNQQLIFSKIQWPNQRTAYTQSSGDSELIMPAFLINDGTDLHRIQWVDNLPIKEFYISFTFWNAMTGSRTRFIPTSKKNRSKQWVQNPNTFVNKNLFLKVILNDDLTYSLYEYDGSEYSIKVNRLSLYQLVYDEYWSEYKPSIEFPEPSNFKVSNISVIPNNEITLDKDSLLATTDLVYPEILQYEYDFETIKIKNTGNTELRLNDIYVTYNGDDQRVSSDKADVNLWGEKRKYYKRTLYTYPKNQKTYYYGSVGSDKVQMSARVDVVSPINQDKANSDYYQKRYSEILSIEYVSDRQKIIKSDDTVNLKIKFSLANDYANTYMSAYLNPDNYSSNSVNTLYFDKGVQGEKPEYNNLKFIPPLYPEQSFNLNKRDFTTKINHKWIVTLEFINNDGELIRTNLDVRLVFKVSKINE